MNFLNAHRDEILVIVIGGIVLAVLGFIGRQTWNALTETAQARPTPTVILPPTTAPRPTPAPTATQVRTATPTPTATPTATPIPTATPTATPTAAATPTATPAIALYEGEIGHLVNTELSAQLVSELKRGQVVQLGLYAYDSSDSRPVAICRGVSARCGGLQWVYDCSDDVVVSQLNDLDGMLAFCHGGNFSLGVDPGDEALDGWDYLRGTWQLEGYFAVDTNGCVTGTCFATVRRLAPEVVASILN